MRKTIISVITAATALTAHPQIDIDYNVGLTANAGSGNFAPTLITNNTHDFITQPYDILARGAAIKPLHLEQRFSWGVGVDIISGYSSSTTYAKYNPTVEMWHANDMHPSNFRLQQLYAEVKFRGVFLTAGLKEYQPALVDPKLSSGDITFSGNTRPIPGFRVGFIDFQNIPLTNGWLQIQGEIGFNKSTDNGWTRRHFNSYYGKVNQGWWYNYKRAYFRTKPSERFSVTFGCQAAGQFSGDVTNYVDGQVSQYLKRDLKFSDFTDMIIPQWGEEYVKGNHVGSWDLKARYRLANGDEISGYFEWIWEDGSGVGKLNGLDGLWGIEYKRPQSAIVRGAVIEYFDFRNQSGPIHWDPADDPGTTVTGEATGYDNYYNNFHHNGYSIYGMAIGSPVLPGPIYNLGGENQFLCNRLHGFHLGILGDISANLDYRLLMSYSKGFGTGRTPFIIPRENTSMMLECNYRIPSVKGLAVKGQAAFDAGRLFGNNFGMLATVSYSGKLSF